MDEAAKLLFFRVKRNSNILDVSQVFGLISCSFAILRTSSIYVFDNLVEGLHQAIITS